MPRKIVVINQAANYLTIGFANAFRARFDEVSLITGSVHVQGEALNKEIDVHWINRWHERPPVKKALSYGIAIVRMWFLLITRYRKYEVFFVSVPPMGYLLNLVLPNRFSMVIWDIYPDVFRITGMEPSHWLFRAWARLNKRSFARAWRVFTISGTLADSLARYVDREKIIVHPIWSIFQKNERIAKTRNHFVDAHGLKDKFVVQYSGNIGVTHNVEILVDIAEQLGNDEQIIFQIIGRGPRVPAIEALVNERALANVQMLPFQSDEEFPFSLSAADLGVVILHEAVSKGSVPSKAYNLMSFGVPGLYIASSESELAHYARCYQHARAFQSDERDEMVQFIRRLAADPALQTEMRRNAETASRDFRRTNADRFVDSYLARQD